MSNNLKLLQTISQIGEPSAVVSEDAVPPSYAQLLSAWQAGNGAELAVLFERLTIWHDGKLPNPKREIVAKGDVEEILAQCGYKDCPSYTQHSGSRTPETTFSYIEQGRELKEELEWDYSTGQFISKQSEAGPDVEGYAVVICNQCSRAHRVPDIERQLWF